MISSLAYEDTIQEAEAVGAKLFLYKPIDRETLLDALEQVIILNRIDYITPGREREATRIQVRAVRPQPAVAPRRRGTGTRKKDRAGAAKSCRSGNHGGR